MAARHSEELEAERKRVSEEEAVAREAALEAAREEFSQQQAKAVANARAAATAEARARAERARTAAVEAAKERERLATEKAQEELRGAKTEWTSEKRRLKEQITLLEEAEQKAKDDLLRAMANSSQATQRARARWQEGQKSAMEKAAAEAVEEREKALEDARRAFNREKKRALLESQDAFAAQAEVMAERIRKQAAVTLREAEALYADSQRENGRLAAEVEKCRKELEECQSSLLHSEADLKEQSVSHSMDTWRMVVAALTLRLGNERTTKQLREEEAERAAAAESTFDAQKETLTTVLEELLELAFESRWRFADMQETLVNHKREVLIDHKVQSSSLHKELDSLARDRDQLEEQRLFLQREFRELETQAKDAEKEAHAHSRQSAIGPDGMIIPARARKKRRLDEELEGLLEAMEVKRKALVAVDGKLGGVAESRAVKDEEMKGLERTLVQVLVEQQKKLLSLLSEASEQAERLQEIDERTRFARDEAKRRKAQARRQRQERSEGVGG